MVSFTALASTVSMALLATTASAAPAIGERDPVPQPPQTWSVIDLSLFKTLQSGSENQCWWWVDQGHPSPSEFVPNSPSGTHSACHKSDFYNLKIDHIATGYNCQVKVYSDDNCATGGYTITYPTVGDCKYPSGSLVNFHSWEVFCQ
ncbi:hypothetical protein F5882DRAFT_411450 [Hyaloscypha sp. PMI_1271]|nr:hypothetical protein F5882DRAFT_411450 [Hyaloscypha sp. PMI_1271]